MRNYNNLGDKSIEESITQVKNSMNRLQAAIHNNNAYSSKNIHYNNFRDNNNNSMIINNYQRNPNNQNKLYYYLNNSNMINPKENKYDRQGQLNKRVLNNSILTEIDSGKNRNYNNNEMLKAYNTENNNINQSINYSNNILKPKNIKLNNNIASNNYREKVLINPCETNTYTNPNISYYKPLGVSPDAKSESITLTKKNPATQKFDDLFKYGEYLTKELKVSNDTNSELLENYINVSTQIKNKNKENNEINNKIKKLKEDEQKLNKANEELIQNITKAQKIIGKNNSSIKHDILEAQKNNDLKQNKINELDKINKNLINIQKNYENEIKELEKILNDYNNEKIDEKYNSNNNFKFINLGKDIDEEKAIINQIEEFKLRNLILQKEIEQLENENKSINNIINYNDKKNNFYNMNMNIINNDNNKYEYEEEFFDKHINDYENKYKSYITQINELKNEVELKNKAIEEIKNDINNMNQNIIEIENKKKMKKEYYSIKNKNNMNNNELKKLDEEIKNLQYNKEQIIIDYNNEIKQLNDFYNKKKEKIFYESIDPETKKIMEENQIMKEENNDIIQSLDNLQDLKKEYDNLCKINLRLKNEIKNL